MSIKTQEFEVSGMTCAHCVMHVEKVFKSIPGVQSATVNLQDKNAVVVYDSDITDSGKLTSSLKNTNYKAQLR